MIDWESLIKNKNLKAKTFKKTKKLKKLKNIKTPKDYFISRLLQWEKTYWKKERTSQPSTYNAATDKLNVHCRKEPYAKLDLNILIKNNQIIKKPIIDTFLDGATFITKEITPKNVKSPLTIQVAEIENVLHKSHRLSLYAFLASCGYEELDLLNNKLKINKQWRKFSKEYRNYLIKTLEFDTIVADNIIQQTSKVLGSNKTETVIWSVNPIDFLKQSAGTTWESCHRCEIDEPSGSIKESYLVPGHMPHPWISQSLDDSSTIAVVIDKKTGLIKSRIPIYIHSELKEMVIGRPYPNASAAHGLISYIKYKAKSKGYTVVGQYANSHSIKGPFEYQPESESTYVGYNDIQWINEEYTSAQIKTIYKFNYEHLRKEIT